MTKPFLEGDRFTLHAGAQARIVYFQGGRQEAYVGPATLIVGAQAELRQARQTYEEMRKAAVANDIVPEQYLYAVLQDHLRYEEMKPVVAEMRKRQPSDPDVGAMADYVKVKTAAR